ncbi:restriction endonuclease [Alkalihalobacillus deserti]|uniref:restriction endonuclease n=1 Tax=Alkalihalobacillus deserti TaxID=2879466 RepID=UPI001D139A12|nr:restriction endonuclease [Alkalihalobacillus deserti]
MGRKRRRKLPKWVRNKENVFLIGIVGFFVLNKINIAIQAFFNNLKITISNFSIFDWVLIATFFIAIILFITLAFNIFRTKKREYLNSQREYRISRNSDYDKLIGMSPAQFEEHIAELFRYLGYEAKVTPKTGDGGKDIILKRDGEMSLVECKKYTTTKVSRPDIQKFHSAIIDMNAKEGFFVTTGYFTQPALEYIVDKPISAIDLPRLLNIIEEIRRKIG